MERELGVLVLMVDAIEGISGAACRLPALDAVLINRRETPGRRHFDLAHELFHILTWDTMPPPASTFPYCRCGAARKRRAADPTRNSTCI